MLIPNYSEDIPSQTPIFDYELVAQALLSLLRQPRKGATVLGIHGAWGSGKTTLINALHRQLNTELGHQQPIFIEFNAWKYQNREALWRALILRVLAELRRSGGDSKNLDELERALYRSFEVQEKGAWEVNWRTLIVEIIGIGLSILKVDYIATAFRSSNSWFARLFIGEEKGKDGKSENSVIDDKRVEKLASVLERKIVKRHIDQVQSVEQFLSEFQKMMKVFTDNGQSVFVFIDDLDRCLPESALEIFEAIKLFLDAPGCSYIVGLDRDVIRKGLAIKYAPGGQGAKGQSLIDPDEYIEKTITLSYDLPRLTRLDSFQFIEETLLPITLDNQHKALIFAALGSSPRRIKRFMNTLALQLHLAALAKAASQSVHPVLLTDSEPRKFDVYLKLLLIAYRYSGVYAASLEDPGLLERLQNTSNTFEADCKSGTLEARNKRGETLLKEQPIVAALQEQEHFWRLFSKKPSLKDENQLVSELREWFRHRPPADTSE